MGPSMWQIYRLEDEYHGTLAYVYAKSAELAVIAYGASGVARVDGLNATAVAHVEPEPTLYIRMQETIIANAVQPSVYGPKFLRIMARIVLTHKELVVRPIGVPEDFASKANYTHDLQALVLDLQREIDRTVEQLAVQTNRLLENRRRLELVAQEEHVGWIE